MLYCDFRVIDLRYRVPSAGNHISGAHYDDHGSIAGKSTLKSRLTSIHSPQSINNHDNSILCLMLIVFLLLDQTARKYHRQNL